MNPDEATSLKQLFLSMLPKDGGIVVGTVTKESPLTIQIENDEKLEISGSALLVPRNLPDYQVKVDIALADGKIDSNTHGGGARPQVPVVRFQRRRGDRPRRLPA